MNILLGIDAGRHVVNAVVCWMLVAGALAVGQEAERATPQAAAGFGAATLATLRGGESWRATRGECRGEWAWRAGRDGSWRAGRGTGLTVDAPEGRVVDS